MSKAPLTQKELPLPATTKVSINLHGLEYSIACDAGEEKKLAELVKLVDGKLSDIARHNAATGTSETRLFMLTCLLLADELIETRKLANEHRKADEALMVAAVDHLRERVLAISNLVGK
ncbi:MAG: cell division protein ZapA [Alphaproteobacteria bacterium]|nr:cell division protein ZapA [Alphaproteobacteria bacterium]